MRAAIDFTGYTFSWRATGVSRLVMRGGERAGTHCCYIYNRMLMLVDRVWGGTTGTHRHSQTPKTPTSWTTGGRSHTPDKRWLMQADQLPLGLLYETRVRQQVNGSSNWFGPSHPYGSTVGLLLPLAHLLDWEGKVLQRSGNLGA